MTKQKIILVDGSSLAFRAFFAMPNVNAFVNNNGLHTNALYGFHTMFKNLLDQEKPSHVLVAFDKGKTTFRNEMYKDYKGGRQKTPPEFSEQMPYFPIMLDNLGIRHYEQDMYEADDIVGTLSKEAEEEGFEVIVVTGDKDLIQLVSDKTRVYYTRKGISDIVAYTPETVEKEFGVTVNQYVDLKALMGDPSDNYPGITLVGPKKAQELLNQFGTIENLYENIDYLKTSKTKTNLINEKDLALMGQFLAEIKRDVPLEIGLEDTVYNGPNAEGLLEFYREMDFNKFTSDLLNSEHGEGLQTSSFESLDFQVVSEVEEAMFQTVDSFYAEMLEDNYHVGEIIGFAWKVGDQHYVAKAETLLNSEIFKAWASDETKAKVVMDGKRTVIMLARQGVEFTGIEDDIVIEAYTLNTKEYGTDIAQIARDFDIQWLQYDEQVYGKGAKLAIPEDNTFFDHLAKKSEAIIQIRDKALEGLEETHQTSLYRDIEMPLSKVLTKIEWTGFKVDPSVLEDLKVVFEERISEYKREIYELAGEEFNLNSPKQLGVILFEKMGLTPIKKTKTGYSTAVGVLEKIRHESPIIDLILEYRQLAKLQSTYVEGLLGYIQADSKIHTRLIQTLTQTGRLSSADPNLQNIPIRTEEGRSIRKAFIPSQKGWQIFASDYSQIELRVLAHISGDKNMIEAFTTKTDIHTSTAAKVFDVELEDVTAGMRRDAKAVNFGIIYGMSDYGLSQNLNITRKQAGEFIASYFESFPGVKNYMDEIVEKAREDGYVETLMERRRYLSDIHSSNFNTRSFAERTAMNSPIQGTAADIIKIAMIKMNQVLEEKGLEARLILQVHDELIFEAPEAEIPVLEEIVPEVMENAMDLDVPLVVESSYGDNWYQV